MESYLIRIYRYQPDNPQRLVGTLQGLEGMEQKASLAFTGPDELWAALQQQLENESNLSANSEQEQKDKRK